MGRQQEIVETATTDTKHDAMVRKFSCLEEHYHNLGGYEANAEAARICDALGLPEYVLDQSLKALSGGQRHRVELAQILFVVTEGSGKPATTLPLDGPTNHLDTDSTT